LTAETFPHLENIFPTSLSLPTLCRTTGSEISEPTTRQVAASMQRKVGQLPFLRQMLRF